MLYHYSYYVKKYIKERNCEHYAGGCVIFLTIVAVNKIFRNFIAHLIWLISWGKTQGAQNFLWHQFTRMPFKVHHMILDSLWKERCENNFNFRHVCKNNTLKVLDRNKADHINELASHFVEKSVCTEKTLYFTSWFISDD